MSRQDSFFNVLVAQGFSMVIEPNRKHTVLADSAREQKKEEGKNNAPTEITRRLKVVKQIAGYPPHVPPFILIAINPKNR